MRALKRTITYGLQLDKSSNSQQTTLCDSSDMIKGEGTPLLVSKAVKDGKKEEWKEVRRRGGWMEERQDRGEGGWMEVNEKG